MHLQSIALRQFRNYRNLELSVDPGVNLFIGSNGAGKTNLIEAIAVLTTGLSPRGADSESMALWGETGFAILGRFGHEASGLEPLTLEMRYRVGAPRQIKQNGSTPVKLRELIGRVPLVSFVPEDLAMVKGEPDIRRRALNMILVQVDPVYADNLRRYNDALKARNAVLKQLAAGHVGRDALEPWNHAVIEPGLVLCRQRARFIEEFSPMVGEILRRITGDKESVRLEYRPSFPGPWEAGAAQRWLECFDDLRRRDEVLGTTAIGPHRDDVVFLLNDRPAREFASEGQKRTCAVAFKLAEIPFVEERLGQKPICLLDDVLSELDAERAEHLLDELSRTGQCFVTMTGLESWPRDRRLPAAIYRVNEKGVTLDSEAQSPFFPQLAG